MINIDFSFIVLGFIIGILLLYVINQDPAIDYKYPTIENIETTTFIDDTDMCYKYYAKEIICDKKSIQKL